jgi:hypothetical protein
MVLYQVSGLLGFSGISVSDLETKLWAESES